jgi:hypothetical protein
VRPAKLEHVIAAGGYVPEETQQPRYHEMVNALKGEQLDISGPALDVCHANWVRTNLCIVYI